MNDILKGTQSAQVRLLYRMIDRQKDIIKQAEKEIERLELKLLKVGQK